jgi:hypothetical protein
VTARPFRDVPVLDERELARRTAEAFGRTAPKVKRAPVAAVPFDRVCAAYGLPVPTPEFRFCERRWRVDYAWVEHRVALEVEGGVWTQGRHTRGAGFLADVEKYNRLAEMGWRLVRCTPSTRDTAATLEAVRAALTHTEA